MKKLFAILAVAAFMTACNDSTKSTTTTTNEDSLKLVAQADSVKNAMQNTTDSASQMMNNAADSATNTMDKMAADSVKK